MATAPVLSTDEDCVYNSSFQRSFIVDSHIPRLKQTEKQATKKTVYFFLLGDNIKTLLIYGTLQPAGLALIYDPSSLKDFRVQLRRVHPPVADENNNGK